MSDVYLEVGNTSYPSDEYSYSPSTIYPEYPWDINTISISNNSVYDMVRNCFIGLGMDIENVGTPKWNPLKDIISEGDTVLLKPNWVMHANSNKQEKENALNCLVTHPSIVRAICDYCIIALNGTGRVIIGDAPMQGCDVKELFKLTGYHKLQDFYEKRDVDVSFSDFREYRSVYDKNKVIIDKEYTGQKSIDVDLGINSMHYSKNNTKKYQVSDYDKEHTNKYHQDEKHSYSINSNILQVDVIINICKPKCHRLAGITGAQKNIVGITYDKSCLPHRTVGSKEEGGDEYIKRSFIKKIISKILSRKIKYEDEKKLKLALLMRYSYGFLYYLVRLLKKDKYLIGSWYGNDTIWRTVIDLNTILLYADKNGIIRDTAQRRVFNFADMIISGEGNGPVSPSSKEVGIIMASYNAVKMDRVICEIMGFDYKKVPGLVSALNQASHLVKNPSKDIQIESNIKEYCADISKVAFPDKWRFKPHSSWIGNIEKHNNVK